MVRNTHQKKVVADVLEQMKGRHPTADTVYDKVSELIPTISRATVYRILNQIAEQGGIQRIHIPESADVYDNNLDCHYHMRCKACGKVLDVDIPVIEGLHDRIPKSAEYEITGYDIVFRGLCPLCKNAAAPN